jgi:hypothetical protein
MAVPWRNGGQRIEVCSLPPQTPDRHSPLAHVGLPGAMQSSMVSNLLKLLARKAVAFAERGSSLQLPAPAAAASQQSHPAF